VMSEDDLGDHLREAILNANRTVVERSQKDSAHKGMGTTSTLALIRGNRVFIAHVGDSRAYLVDKREKTIVQLTSDHSFVQALVMSGHITPEQAKNHPMGHVLYRALGQSLELDVDLYTRTLRAGDRLVVCSDGLTRHLSPEDITETVLKTDNPTEATLDLIEMTNSRGAEDNVSVIVVMIDQVEQP
jgi:serine/threonine protein phosphatase PrpC